MPVLAYLFGLVIAHSVPPSPAAPLVSSGSEPTLRHQLADDFRDAQRLAKIGFDTTFEVVMYPAVPAGTDPTSSPPFSRTRIRYLVSGNRMRVESVQLEEAESQPVLQVNVWASGEWSHRRDDRPNVAFSDRAGPVDVPGQGYLFNMMDGRIPGLMPIAKILREGQIVSQAKKGDIVHSDVVPSFGRDGMVVYHVEFRKAPVQELERLSIEIFTGSPKVCKTRQVFHVTEWQDYDGVRLPSVAELKAWQASISTDRVQGEADILTVYRRTAFRLLDPSEDLSQAFRTPLPPGTKVHDARQGMSYEIGADYLFIDGVMYKLEAPLQAPPGEALGDLMRTAKSRVAEPSARPNKGPLGGSIAPEEQASQTRGWTQVVFGGLVVAIVCIVPLVILRRWLRPAN